MEFSIYVGSTQSQQDYKKYNCAKFFTIDEIKTSKIHNSHEEDLNFINISSNSTKASLILTEKMQMT